jgi:hypothetical protein
MDYLCDVYRIGAADTRAWYPPKLPAFPKVPAAGQGPVGWQRQVIWAKDEKGPGGVYMVVRDTVTGGQPTQWQFWTYSDGINSGDAGKADDKGWTPATGESGPRKLSGNLLVAAGQAGLDLQYFIAAPADSPRQTITYATPPPLPEHQDLLHLQLPGDGCYFVAMYPHMHDEEGAEFAPFGDGNIIQVRGSFGTDYVYLADRPGESGSDELGFKGLAGLIQDRVGHAVLSLGQGGEVHLREMSLKAPIGCSALIDRGACTLSFSARHDEATVTLGPGGNWKITQGDGAKLTKPGEGAIEVTVPAGLTTVKLLRQ